MSAELRQLILDWLDDNYHFGEAARLVKTDDTSFLKGGILDSLGFVQLILHLENRLRIKIERKQLSPKNFDSMGKILAYITAHPGYRGGRVTPLHMPSPATVEGSQMTAFARFCERESGVALPDYTALHTFSITDVARFWMLFLRFSGAIVDGDPEPACVGAQCESARFFPGLSLSYVENLLAPGDSRAVAVTAVDETGRLARLTRAELRRQVRGAAAGLRALGVAAGDRAVAIAGNDEAAVVACLGATALGAAWSSVPPDLAHDAVVERFAPLAPAVLFARGAHSYQGAERALGGRIAALLGALPSVRALVALDAAAASLAVPVPVIALAELASHAPLEELPRLPFDHPLFILFSSGTTGPPKAIVHGAGGTLLEHAKEHALHCNLGASDRMLFQTSCGWMMWNWQLSALARGTEIVLYDGSVSFPDEDSLLRRVAELGVTQFGTSPAYLQYCRSAEIVARERFDLGALRAVLSTGSILDDALCRWTYDAVKAVPVQSISGGTDIIGCFVLGNPNLPVYAGELQCLGLGMDVRALPTDAAIGELVCAAPFPSRPVGLYGDSDGLRFHQAYFSQNPGVWTHGDFIEISERGARIHGRSDGVINVRGIRIGPSEIYRALTTVPEIEAAMAVEQAAPDLPGGSRLVLLVVLAPGVPLDRPLTLRIKKEISTRTSMAHVPAVIAAVPELPVTHNGKRSERAARDAVNGRPAANLSALRNPDSLHAIAAHPLLR